jgi:peptidoglycan L-alanyl-D-glutamate endopeptidase CwlK
MPPKEVPVNRSLADLAPAVRVAAERVLAGMKADGFKCVQFDTLRSADRQNFLFGKGRTPEQCIEKGISAHWAWPTCPDGKVTKATHGQSWHAYGLAVDFVENDATPWTASQAFWHALSKHAIANGFTWGGSWTRFPDLPHCQWAKVPTGPPIEDILELQRNGPKSSWAKYHAL